MLATPGKAFTSKDWIFELKYDGYRLFAEKHDGRVTLYSRAGNDLTQTFPDVIEIVAALPYESFVIDGEVIVNDERGLPSFASLQKRGRISRRIDAERAALDLPATFYAFDLVAFGSVDLRPLALVDRKEALLSREGFVSKAPAAVVERERRDLEQLRAELTLMQEQLSRLQGMAGG